MKLMADVLFNDPTPHQFNNYKNSVDKNDINNHLDKKKQYLLAKLYLEGSKKFSIPKNCDKALQILLALSKAHIADADYTLFTMYYHGNCVERDIDKARSLLEKSADLGYIPAQKSLGDAYSGSMHLYARDMDKAIKWFKSAANSGDMSAAGILSFIYKEGLNDGDVNNKKAYKWALKAAELSQYEEDIALYFYMLAPFYEQGIGTGKDLVKAYKYYALSGYLGDEDKQRVLKNMTPEQRQAGQKLVNEWVKKHHVDWPDLDLP